MKNYWGYQGKVCVVTGASSGIGKATARMLVDLGARVYALARNPVQVEGLAGSIQVDLALRESMDAAFAQIPQRIDSFFGIAGATGHHTDYLTTFHTNFTCNQYMIRKFVLPRMESGGSITFVTSTSGLRWEWKEKMELSSPVVNAGSWEEVEAILLARNVTDQHGKLAYAPAKRAMNHFAAQLAVELGPKKIRVNAVLPGSTETGMTSDFVKSLGSMERLVKYTGFAQRLASPEEMAGPLVFLGSDMASYLSGVHLVVDCALNTNIILGNAPDMFAY